MAASSNEDAHCSPPAREWGDMSDVEALVDQMRNDALVGSTQARPRHVQVMNLHQTKGREADETILLLQPDEFYGRESEPYLSGSRLLYVVLTRARHVAHIVVPPEVHDLWKPLIEASRKSLNVIEFAPPPVSQEKGVSDG